VQALIGDGMRLAHNCILPDARAHGQSEHATEFASPRRHAQHSLATNGSPGPVTFGVGR